MIVRRLAASDADQFDRFLARHADTSMTLRAAARRQGLDAGFFGAFAGRLMRGVLHLAPGGNLYPEAPETAALRALHDVARADAPEFEVKGVLGRATQARALLDLLNPPPEAVALSREERIWSLDLERLFAPRTVVDGVWTVRKAVADDLPLLTRWNCDFRIEGLGAKSGEMLTDAVLAASRAWIADGACQLLMVHGEPVAQCVYSAVLPDQVQIGSVYTPPDRRGRGYGKAVVAAALIKAQKAVVRRSTLFTQNRSAEAAYTALGYRHTGDYHLALFSRGVPLGGQAPSSSAAFGAK
jgi:predicted GNAT family acetyltransferase